MHSVSRSILFSIAGFFLFSTSDATGKVLIQTYDVFVIQFWSSLAAALCILLFAPKLGGLRSLAKTDMPFILFAKSCLTAGLLFASISALRTLDMTTFYTIVLLAPLLTALLARVFFREALGVARSLLILVGFAGVLVVLRPGIQEFQPGVFFAILSITLFACNNLLSKLIPHDGPKLPFAFYPYVLMALACFALTGAHPALPSAGNAWMFVLIGLCSVMAIVALIKAFQLADAGIAAPFHYTQLIWGTAFGFVLFGDVPDLWTIVGGAIIAASGLGLYYVEWKKPGVAGQA